MRAKSTKTIVVTESQLKAVVQESIDKKYKDLVIEIATKLLAVSLIVLDKKHGWRKKRLLKFLDDIQSEASLLDVGNILGQEITAKDFVDYIKKYDINLKEEISKML